MPRIARVVIPDIPHHIIQRGNRRQPVFFSDDDRSAYLDYLCLHAKPAGISIWAYCLMDNHVHLIAVPKHKASFADGFSESQKRYSRRINFRENWRGHLWEGRFKSYPLDEFHLYAAMRYVERNPVRAKIVIAEKPSDDLITQIFKKITQIILRRCSNLCNLIFNQRNHSFYTFSVETKIVKQPWEYPWSSAQAHIKKENDKVIDSNFVTNEIKDWAEYIAKEDNKNDLVLLRNHSNTGRPLGDKKFIDFLEKISGRMLHRRRPGPRVIKNNGSCPQNSPKQ